MKVILLRHGETAGNAMKRYIGATDEPLSTAGREAALAVPPDRTVGAVFVSPLLRARETASLLFPAARQYIVPDLREMDFGVFENRSYTEMEDDADYRAWVQSGCTLPCPRGESMESFSLRTEAAFVSCIEQAKRLRLENAVFCVHGGTIMAVMHRFASDKKTYYEWCVQNLCGYSAKIVQNTPGGSISLGSIRKISR